MQYLSHQDDKRVPIHVSVTNWFYKRCTSLTISLFTVVCVVILICILKCIWSVLLQYHFDNVLIYPNMAGTLGWGYGSGTWYLPRIYSTHGRVWFQFRICCFQKPPGNIRWMQSHREIPKACTCTPQINEREFMCTLYNFTFHFISSFQNLVTRCPSQCSPAQAVTR